VEERTEAEAQVWAEKVIPLTPMKRFGQPEELKGLAVLLASDASSFVTGADLCNGWWLGWCAW